MKNELSTPLSVLATLLKKIIDKLFRRHGVRTRVTWLLVFVFSVSLALSSALMIRAFIQSSMTSFDLHLYNHAIDLSASIDESFLKSKETPSMIMRKKSNQQILPFHRSFLQISTLDGKLVSKSANLRNLSLPTDSKEVQILNSNNAHYKTLSSASLPIEDNLGLEEFRLISTLIVRPPLQTLVLQIAAPLTVVEQSVDELRKYLLFMIPITIFIALFFGMVFSNQALVPMSKMIAQARRIEQGELSERIPVPNNDSELAHLATTLNQLLDRLIKMISTQQRFIADASHQFKTPLAIMKTQIEKKESIEQLGHLIRLTENLLTMAQVDAEKNAKSFHEFRIDEMILDITSNLEKIAAQRNIRINTNFFEEVDLDVPFTYYGDSVLLKHLSSNLIENAIKYSSENSTVSVEMIDAKNSIYLLIKDNGPGIRDVEKLRVFDRFYRGKSTSVKTSGSGLGLSIALSIAELHGGTILIKNNTPTGSIFKVELPKPSV